MKKLFLAAAAIFCCMTASAQIFVTAAYCNEHVLRYEKNGDSYNKYNTPSNGFQVGVGYNFGFSSRTYLETSLRYEYNYFQSGMIYPYKSYEYESYLALPVHFGFRIELSNEINLLLALGPQFFYGISSYDVIESASVPATKTDNYGEGGYSRFDMSLGLRIGLEFCERFRLTTGWEYCIIDRITGVNKEHSSIINTSLTYLFNI